MAASRDAAILNTYNIIVLLNNDWLVLRNKSLHDCPCQQISNCTDAEYNHIAGWLALETKECVAEL